jgi:divalent metal cation (Fe/Co/Zn/Cd) transporter
MWALLRAKLKAAAALDSAVLRADAFCTQSCMWLSGVLLAGSFLFSATGYAWFDALASLGMAWLVYREGLENWRGEECGCQDGACHDEEDGDHGKTV